MLLTILTEGYPYVMLEYSQVTNQIALYLKKWFVSKNCG